MITITNEQIQELALDNGFKLKEQPNGTLELNPYVYEFARALLNFKPAPEAYVPLPNCMCFSPEAEKFCMLQRKCSKVVAL
jgi:hypothetical protein